jgi:phosphate transport system substrate-binding protein
VQNAAKKFVLPAVASTRAAAAAARSPKPNSATSLVNPPASAANAYPIATFTYVIVPKRAPKAQTLRQFLTYAVTGGQTFGPKLLFAPLPAAVAAADKQAVAQIR